MPGRASGSRWGVNLVGDIERDLRADAERIGRKLLPHGVLSGSSLMVGELLGERGTHIGLAVRGKYCGQWKDFRSGDGGDMLDLIAAVKFLDKGGAVAWAKAELGIVDDFKPGVRPRVDPEAEARALAALRARQEADAVRHKAEQARKMKNARGLFLAGAPIAGTPAEHYLRGRGIDPGALGWPGSLRFHPDVPNKESGRALPCLLAAVFDCEGVQLATHRIWLGPNTGTGAGKGGWGKASLALAKMALGPMGGGFVPIAKGVSGKSMRSMPTGEAVWTAEGIEDALVVRMFRPADRIVAAISLGNIGLVRLPTGAGELIVCADRDDNEAAQLGLERAIAKQQARGMKVRLVMPPAPYKDFNEWLQAGLPAQHDGWRGRAA